MLGTILSVTNLALTAGIIVVLWVYRKRLFAVPAENITPRQYTRMTARLDQFELSETHRAKLDLDFRRTVIAANHSQLVATEKQNGLLETLVRRLNFVATTLDQRPCLVGNGLKECPEGHGGESDG